MYFDNHQQCYFNDGAGGKPHLLYKLGGSERLRYNPPSLKIWAVLLYHNHIVSYHSNLQVHVGSVCEYSLPYLTF